MSTKRVGNRYFLMKTPVDEVEMRKEILEAAEFGLEVDEGSDEDADVE